MTRGPYDLSPAERANAAADARAALLKFPIALREDGRDVRFYSVRPGLMVCPEGVRVSPDGRSSIYGSFYAWNPHQKSP